MKWKELSEIKYGRVLFIIDFILPLPLTALMIWLWYLRTNNLPFSIYVLVLPVLFGYIIPGIGTNILKLWAFKWSIMRVGNYFIHHGFLFAPYFAISFYLTFGRGGEISLLQAATIIISNSFLQCFLSVWHDYWAVKSGMIEIYNTPFKEGKSAAEIILDYMPVAYVMFGAAYTISCLVALRYFEDGTTSVLKFVLLLLSGVSLMGLTGVHYIIRERRKG